MSNIYNLSRLWAMMKLSYLRTQVMDEVIEFAIYERRKKTRRIFWEAKAITNTQHQSKGKLEKKQLLPAEKLSLMFPTALKILFLVSSRKSL